MSFASIEDYRHQLNDTQLWWFDQVVHYVKGKYPNLSYKLSYQRPMFVIKPKLFLMLGGGKHHFSIYTTDFECVSMWKTKKIPGLKFGKSAILFPLEQPDMIKYAYQLCDDVMDRSTANA